MDKLLADLILYTIKGTTLYLGDFSSTTVIYIYKLLCYIFKNITKDIY